jgi:hypothetical protein
MSIPAGLGVAMNMALREEEMLRLELLTATFGLATDDPYEGSGSAREAGAVCST